MTTHLPARLDDPRTAVAAISDTLLATVAESQRQGHLTDEAITTLEQQGLTRLSWPTVHGGHQASTAAHAEALAALAQIDGSLAWTTAIYTTVAHMVIRVGDRAFYEVADSLNPRAAGVFATTGHAHPARGGWQLSGRWAWCSGQHHAGWIIAPAVTSEGPTAFLVPRTDFTVLDDWHYTGLLATGSNTVTLDDVFVPAHRALPFSTLVEPVKTAEHDAAAGSLATEPYYAQAFIPVLCAISAGPPVGLARAALGLFRERIHQRGITYTPYEDQADAPLTHQQAHAAATALFHAEAHLDRLTTTVDTHIHTGRSWDTLTRARCRADLAEAVYHSRQACEIIESASGATALHRTSPLARILRDIRALSMHSFLLHTTATTPHGEALCRRSVSVPYI